VTILSRLSLLVLLPKASTEGTLVGCMGAPVFPLIVASHGFPKGFFSSLRAFDFGIRLKLALCFFVSGTAAFLPLLPKQSIEGTRTGRIGAPFIGVSCLVRVSFVFLFSSTVLLLFREGIWSSSERNRVSLALLGPLPLLSTGGV